MKIGELTLPSELEAALESGPLSRARGSRSLKRNRDAYGNDLEAELSELYDAHTIAAESAMLSTHFACDGVYGASAPEFAGPGAIPDIVDFTEVLCFGISGDGAPFCLDYRTRPPSVIWWDDVYWRRIAPTFAAFLDLLDLPPHENR